MNHSIDRLRNIIVCDDIRTETGNKHSLMGVLSGDIIVSEIPATINLAIYMQYFAAPKETGEIAFQFRLTHNDEVMAMGRFKADVGETKIVNLVLPRALVTFDKDGSFNIFARLNDEPEQMIASKKIIKGLIP